VLSGHLTVCGKAWKLSHYFMSVDILCLLSVGSVGAAGSDRGKNRDCDHPSDYRSRRRQKTTFSMMQSALK
jgi:hypothetical protein